MPANSYTFEDVISLKSRVDRLEKLVETLISDKEAKSGKSDLAGLQARSSVSPPYRGTAPFVKTSDTSRESAKLIEPVASSLRYKVLSYFREKGFGTDDDVEAALEMKHQTVSARRRELVLSGHLEDSGNRRKTRSGRPATVWRITLEDVRSRL